MQLIEVTIQHGINWFVYENNFNRKKIFFKILYTLHLYFFFLNKCWERNCSGEKVGKGDGSKSPKQIVLLNYKKILSLASLSMGQVSTQWVPHTAPQRWCSHPMPSSHACLSTPINITYHHTYASIHIIKHLCIHERGHTVHTLG